MGNSMAGRRPAFRHFAMLAVLLLAGMVLGACAASSEKPSQPGSSEHVRTVEGIQEHRLDNGMKVLLVPDQSSSKVTVNTTYFVGSRHESYGETGMAHLLEHMLFYGTESHPDIKAEISERGGRANGTTWFDRTNYFQTFPSSDENLQWALSMEADRMVNAYFSAEDLASEMTVVRNEFEIGENSPFRVLMQRVMGVAHEWHGYGRSTIGARSDIEGVPFQRLRDFYRRYYQPDNAMVVISGDFDVDEALDRVENTFGRLSAPEREGDMKLWDTYTREPTQDGERTVTVRRAGDSQYLMASYHVPSSAHPEFTHVNLLAHVLGNSPSGRLHEALVDTELASEVGAFTFSLNEPGELLVYAQVPGDKDLDEVEAVLRETLNGVAESGITEEEADRARSARLRSIETGLLNDSQQIGISLTEWAASGDWRLLFLHRDRLKESGVEDIQAAAETYLRRDNRTIGRFIPDSDPERTDVPEVDDLDAVMAAHEFTTEGRSQGESFDSSPANIQDRLVRRELSNGMRLEMLPKNTRGNRVVGSIVMRLGDEDSLSGLQSVGGLTGAMLMRGTEERDRQAISDRLDELQSSLTLGGSVNRAVADIDTRRDKLEAVLDLAAEVLQQPAFDAGEFDELKRSRITGLREAMTQPQARAFTRMRHEQGGRDSDHPEYAATMDESLEALQAVELDSLRAFHDRFYGAGDASLVLIGDFDPDAVYQAMEARFGDWEAEVPYQRIPADDHDPEGQTIVIDTPDRANAALAATHRVHLSDEHEDYAAMAMVNHLLGGGFLSARLAERIRNEEGLSYGVGSGFNADSFENAGEFFTYAFFAPQNRERLVEVLREELNKAVEEGFTAEELEAGKQGWLQSRAVSRADDESLATIINNNFAVGRDMLREQSLDQAIRDMDIETVNAVARRHLKPERLTLIIAGDFSDDEDSSDEQSGEVE